MKTTFNITRIAKTFFILIALVSGSFYLQAQCSQYAAMTNQITSDQTVNGSALLGYWVCEGVHLTVLSSQGLIYLLEKNATITFTNTEGDAVWAKDSCVITNNSTQGIALTCNPSTVTLHNNSSGSITIANSCTSVIYDYTLTGGGPCIASGINDISGSLPTHLFPDPVISSFMLSIDNDQNFKHLTFVLYNVLGEEVKRVENITQKETEVSRGNLQSGFYMYKLLNENITVNSGKIIMK